MISMIWLIYGGTYLFATYFVLANPQDIDFYYDKYAFIFIASSYLGIDVFLFISAILSTFMFLNMKDISVIKILRSYLIRFSKFFILVLSIMFTGYVAIG